MEVLEWSKVEQEYIQAKLKQQVARAVEQERYKWQEKETELLSEITGIKKQQSKSSKTNIAQIVCAGQGVDSIIEKYVSNVGCYAGPVITTTDYSSTACSPPHVGLVNSSVSGMSINTTVEGVTAQIPLASQYSSSIVVNADSSNMSVAGELAASSLPHMHVVYPLHNNIYSHFPMLNLPAITRYSGEDNLIRTISGLARAV